MIPKSLCFGSHSNVCRNRLTSTPLITALLFLCPTVTIATNAQQVSQGVRVSTLTGMLEITAKNQAEFRLISVKLDSQVLKEFKTDLGVDLDLLATYEYGAEATYIVLRTNMGQGACVPTDIYVLTLHEYDDKTQKKTPRLEISPVLQGCL